jgi:hypothetical protein
MATEKQFAFFKSLYDEECKRGEELHDHAKNNLGLVTLYSAFILFVIEKLRPESTCSKLIFVATILCMLAAFLLSLWATQISIYEAVNEPADILEELGDSQPDDEDFFDDRIADYTVAYERDSEVNDKKANQLLVARYFLLVGIALHACYFIVLLV